jgi:outer membrane protein TolC
MQKAPVGVTLAANIALTAVQQASFEEQIAVTGRLFATQHELLRILQQQLVAGAIAQSDVAVQETALAQTKLHLAPSSVSAISRSVF